MKNVEEQLNSLPRPRLPLSAVVRFYARLFLLLTIKSFSSMKKYSYALSAGVAVLALVAGFTTYAYGSVTVTHGSPLFALKTGVESVRLAVASKGLPTVNAYLDLSNRRMAEARYLAANAEFKQASQCSLVDAAYAAETEPATLAITETIHDAVSDVESAMTETTELTKPEEAQTALQAIRKTQKIHSIDLKEIASKISLNNNEATVAISAALASTQTNATAVENALAENDAKVKDHADTVTVEVKSESEATVNSSLTLEQVQKEFDQFKTDKEAFLAKLASLPQNEHIAKLTEKLSDWETKISEAIKESNYGKAHGLIRAGYALQQNEKYFISDSNNETEKDAIKRDLEKQRHDAEDEDSVLKNEDSNRESESEDDNEDRSRLESSNANTDHEEDNKSEEERD